MSSWVYICGVLAAVVACSGEAAPTVAVGANESSDCFVGDATLEPAISLVYRSADGTVGEIESGTRVPLVQPPQGGMVMFIGVRAQNMNGCPLQMSSALIQPGSDAVIALERRPVSLEPGADGWLAPKQPSQVSNYSNLPACPRANLETRIDEQPYSLRVGVEDPQGRHADATVQIEPTCGEPEHLELCRCECSTNYTLGAECNG